MVTSSKFASERTAAEVIRARKLDCVFFKMVRSGFAVLLDEIKPGFLVEKWGSTRVAK